MVSVQSHPQRRPLLFVAELAVLLKDLPESALPVHVAAAAVVVFAVLSTVAETAVAVHQMPYYLQFYRYSQEAAAVVAAAVQIEPGLGYPR